MNSDEEQCRIDEENSETGEHTVEQEVVIGSPEKRPRIVQNVGIPAIWNFFERGVGGARCKFCNQKVGSTENCYEYLNKSIE